jgi:hypothetical protein
MKTLILFFITNLSLLSQDIINLKDGNEIYSKVLKISEKEIEYKKFSNINGPVYVKSISEISSIKYENGAIESFQSQEKTISAPQAQNKIEAIKSNYITVKPPLLSDSLGLAKVIQINGIDIYFMNKPMVEYNIVYGSGDMLSDIDLKSIFWGGLSRNHIKEKMEKIVNAAFRKSSEMNIPFHGIIYSGGTKAAAIQYTSNDLPMERLAHVDKYEDLDIFVLCKPLNRKYEVVYSTSAKTGELTSFLSLGLVNNTMDKDIRDWVAYMKKRNVKFDAVLYIEGSNGEGILYK